MLRAQGTRINSVFVIQNAQIHSKMAMQALSLQGMIPVFVICPNALTGPQRRLSKGLDKVIVCAWEKAFAKIGPSLPILIDKAFKESNIDGPLDGAESIPYEELQNQVESRVRNLRTLPTMPEIVLRIMKLVSDPNSSVEALEELLLSDASIVQKLLEVINSPLFAGVGKKGKWTLKEAIVRMGLKNAVAQQVKLMNAFSNPEESDFDMRRFWEHSVGCAILADKICTGELIELESPIEFDDYWIGSILHDIGKLVLGLFFWEHFENVVNKMKEGEQEIPFREAETQLGDMAHHEYIGELLLVKSRVKEELVEVVKGHHSLGEAPGKLTCLVHVVNNISKELGMGYDVDETSNCSEVALRELNMDESAFGKIRETAQEFLVTEIKALVSRCL